MGFITQGANKINTFKNMLLGGSAVETRMAAAVANGAGKWGARGRGLVAAASEFAGAGVSGGAINDMKLAFSGARGSGKGFFGSGLAALDTIGADTFKKGYGSKVGIGAGVGAVAGGAKAYYDGDDAGGYATNILGGAVLGAAGGHAVQAARTPGTVLGNAGKAFKAGWKA